MLEVAGAAPDLVVLFVVSASLVPTLSISSLLAFTRARVESTMHDLCMRALQPGRGHLISGSSGLWWRMQGGGQGV